MALGLYTLPLTGLVLIGHGISVFVIERFRLSKTITYYLLATGVGLLAFTPWLLIFINNISTFQAETDWAAVKVSRLFLVKAWLINISYAFLDGRFSLSFPILILVGYSIYFLCRHAQKRAWLFILTLMGVTALALTLPDLILGGHRSTTIRYVFPCYLGMQLAVAYFFMQLAVAYFLTTQITSISINIWRRKLWQIIMIALIFVGV